MANSIPRAQSIEDLRRIAQRRLPKSVFEFIDGGAEDELTLADNRAGFERVRLVPRVLTDVSDPSITANLLGTTIGAPIVIAPMGSCKLVWPDADIAIARAAASLGIPYTLSTMSNTSIERMADAVQGELWFQLYVLKDRVFIGQLIDRAQTAGYTSLVVTLDLQAGGKREKDLRNGIQIPLKFGWRQLLDGALHPHWAWQAVRGGLPQFENVSGYGGLSGAGLTIAARVGQNVDSAFGWDGFKWLRERWRGKLLVKGVEHPEDARLLAEQGADGIWVSNHGGRQLDGAISSIDALPDIARATAGRVALLIDSGVRRGVDILKARVLGASAVAIGRAALYGAAAGGPQGAQRALDILTGELRLAMKLAGTPSMADAAANLPAVTMAPLTQLAPLEPNSGRDRLKSVA